jgi:CMP-N-acetylneuraminic acid synthetase
LIERAFECGVKSRLLDRIILSTDDPAIRKAAEDFGLEAPFLRPKEFARDDSPMIDVAVHALTALDEAGYRPDALLLLQPTSPFRKPEHIREAIRRLDGNDSVCSVHPVPQTFSPHYLMKIGADGYLDFCMPDGASYGRRQDVPLACKRDGTIFLTRTEVLLRQRSFYGRRCIPMIMQPEESLNIDTAKDWAAAERLLSRTPW